MPTPRPHSTADGVDLHEGKRHKEPVRAASTANVNTASPGTTLDGVTLVSGDRVLLKNQTTGSQNGIYVWTGAAAALTRSLDADTATDFTYGFLVYVREGTANATSYWKFDTTTAITLGTTSLTFTAIGSSVFSGEVTGTDFNASGLTGATSASRYVGATTGGPPSSGTFALGDYVVARNTTAGQPAGWLCTVAGSPGTWVPIASNPMIAVGDMIVGGTVANGYAAETRVAAGTSGQVLTAQGVGVAPVWAAATGGGGSGGGGSGAIVPIQVIGPLTAAQASMSFSSIPQTGFRNLVVTYQVRGTVSALQTALLLQFNGDMGTNYDVEYAAVGSGVFATGGEIFANTSLYPGDIPAATAPAGAAASGTVRVNNFNSTTFRKQAFTPAQTQKSSDAATGFKSWYSFGEWRSTAAISSMQFTLSSGNFDVGSYMCLYGEMDTAGPLLTPASNLLYETTLTAAAASITTGTLSQAYRDLQVEISGLRGDAAAAEIGLLLRFNNDSGANYDWSRVSNANTTVSGAEGVAATSIQNLTTTLGVTANTATAGAATGITIDIPGYADTTFWKTCSLLTSDSLGTGAGNRRVITSTGWWHNTGAITSIQIAPSSGNWMAGATVRVYGLPALAGGASTGTGTRLRISASQSITDSTDTYVNWDTEDADADNQHYTSSANLTGTVAKVAASQTLTGTTTAFTTELSVGQVISVPGTATEKRVVIAIASNTSLTVNSAFVNTASGQVGTRVNSAIVFRQPGQYEVNGGCYWASNATGYRSCFVVLNDTTEIARQDSNSVGAVAMGQTVTVNRPFQQWDFVELKVRQTSGGALNLTTDERTFFASNSRPTVIVAVPYVNVQDQKASGTSGGSTTTGSWQTHVLNTLVTDTGGITSAPVANQLVLPSGIYRTHFAVVGYATGVFQARLQNITDTSTLILGSNASTNNANAISASSIGTGRFTLTGSKTLELQMRTSASRATDGFGPATSWGTEVYAVLEVWKES